jgi:hypothetical protein
MVAVPMPVLRRGSASITGGAIFVAMPVRRTLVCAIVLVLAFAASSAAAKSRVPWATVNICDTASNPDTVGIRGSMPGNGAAGEMFMRLQVQFQRDDGSWRLLGAGGDSGFIDVGSSRSRTPRQGGQSFQVAPPSAGSFFIFRGLVTFEWRSKRGAVVRRAVRRTTGGHRSTAGADPPGFTSAVCTISA